MRQWLTAWMSQPRRNEGEGKGEEEGDDGEARARDFNPAALSYPRGTRDDVVYVAHVPHVPYPRYTVPHVPHVAAQCMPL